LYAPTESTLNISCISIKESIVCTGEKREREEQEPVLFKGVFCPAKQSMLASKIGRELHQARMPNDLAFK